MSEILEAEAFSRELDKLLDGRAVDASGEAAKDLEFAAALSRSDFSSESRVKRSLKAKLLTRPESRLRNVFSWMKARPVVAVAFASLLVVLAAPPAMKWIAASGDDAVNGSLQQGWRAKGGGMFEGSGSSAYEPGTTGLAPGAAIGGSGDGGESGESTNAPDRSALTMDVPRRYGGVKTDSANTGLNASAKTPILSAGSSAGDNGPGAVSAAGAPVGGDQNKDGKNVGESLADLKEAAAPSARGFRAARPKAKRTRGGMQNAFVLPPIPGEAAPEQAAPQEDFNREGYNAIDENPYLSAADNPLSTFSIDVDAASYANVRRILGEGRLPPRDAVRVEELVNYFHYDYPEPKGDDPFSITAESADCPWNGAHKLVRIGLKGKSIAKENLPSNNLVFLIDSSGSMMDADKMPLLKRGLRLLVDQMRPQDRITIATYAGEAGLVLPATPGDQKEKIVAALEGLEAGGSTAGGAGIKLAYDLAAKSFIKGGVNRVILATDGDFNVGVTSDGELTELIERERDRGVFLTVLGFGRGNYQDSKMKMLADKGNGNYAYVDDIMEARRVLVREMGATLMTIAKDVKIQVEFNPARVSAYRLIGYESRLLKAQDFNDDKKDAGELGAGHTVTALYEIVPAGADAGVPSIDPLKYQKTRPAAEASASGELLTVKFRYKKPDGDTSRLIERVLDDKPAAWSAVSPDFKFAAAAAGFGMLLRGSPNAGDLTYAKVRSMARAGAGRDEYGDRGEFERLVEKAGLLAGAKP